MNGDDEAIGSGATARWMRFALLALLCFLLGLAAMAWLLSHWETGARLIGITTEPVPVVTPVPAPRLASAPTSPSPPGSASTDDSGDAPERVIIDPEVSRRVAALERRVAEIDTQSRSAVGNADRAEGLLVAFAARRALDRGVGLGFLEGLLRQRFGRSQPRAVGMIILAAQNPVTLQELQSGLQELGPKLVGLPADATWWDAIRAELGGLITVRRRDTPSPEPSERLRRATQRLQAGQVDVALAEVLRLPGRARAADWIRKARLYADARNALDTIETAALLEPRAADIQPRPAPAQPQPATTDAAPANTHAATHR